MVRQADNEGTGNDHSEVLNGRRPACDARLLEAVRESAPTSPDADDELIDDAVSLDDGSGLREVDVTVRATPKATPSPLTESTMGWSKQSGTYGEDGYNHPSSR